ncbi:hypothetical protein ABTH81_20550, partial [Acinetobacter baumannii]
DDQIERIAGHGIAEHGIVGGLPAHGGTPLAFFDPIVAGFSAVVVTRSAVIAREELRAAASEKLVVVRMGRSSNWPQEEDGVFDLVRDVVWA